MKRNGFTTLMAACFGTLLTLGMMAGCSGGDDPEWSDPEQEQTEQGGSSKDMGGNASNNTAGDDLDDFDITIDTSALTESETIPTDESDEDYEDYIENNTFNNTITITYDGTSATVSGSVDDVDVTTDGAYVTVNSSAKKVAYVLKGTSSQGQFKIYSEKKFELELNGLTLNNPTGAAINVQSKKRVFVVLADGTENTLTDGTSYTNTPDDEDEKGTFFSEGQLLFSGSGQLKVTANAKSGIVSDDYIRFRPGNNIYVTANAKHGIKANDYIIIGGGVLNVELSSTAGKGINCEGYIEVNGGRTTVITTGGGEYDEDDNDTSACAGIKADSIININAGTLYLKSTGAGGKGINCDQDINISGGTIYVNVTGKRYSYSSSIHSSAKGIKADGDINISGGTIKVRAGKKSQSDSGSGDEGSEGIESKGAMNITGGTVEVAAYDDAINAGGVLTISDGYIYAFSVNNDGIDGNNNIYINGGTIVALGKSDPETGIDAAEGYNLYINGGYVLAVGGSSMVSYPGSSSTQYTIAFTGSFNTGTSLAIGTGSSYLAAYKVVRGYSGGAYLVSVPGFKNGTSYTVYSGATVSGTDWHGFYTSPTVSSAGSSAGTATASATAGGTNSMGGGGGTPGGSMPGGGGRR